MRILRVSSDIYPYSIGGLGIHVHELSKAIVRKGHEVTVFTCNNVPKESNDLSGGYEIKRFKPIFNSFGNAIAPSMLVSLLRHVEDFDVVHAHSHLFFSTGLSALVRKLKHVPLVITNHGLVSQTAPMWLQKFYLPTIAKWIFLNADRVICYTSEMGEEMRSWGITSNNVKVIHNGVNIKIFKPYKTNKEYDIIWVGRYTPGKGIEYLIYTLTELKKEFKDLRVLMVGNGPSKKSIEKKVADNKLTNNIDFIEQVKNCDLPLFYNKSRLFILTSLEEGVPRTVLEAMSCGLPVVCSNLPQLKKLVENCGTLINKKNVTGFSRAVKDILDDGELAKKFGHNARNKIVKDYLWGDTVSKTIEMYEELI